MVVRHACSMMMLVLLHVFLKCVMTSLSSLLWWPYMGIERVNDNSEVLFCPPHPPGHISLRVNSLQKLQVYAGISNGASQFFALY